jgi:hypothetical protein
LGITFFFNNLHLEIKTVADNQKKFKLALKKILSTYTFYAIEEYLTHSWIMYYTTRLLIIVVYWFTILSMGIQLVLMDFFLSFCPSTLCTYSLIVHSELITFLCINLIWFIYCIIITNYYYMYYCSDSFCTAYVVIYWQVLYPLWWISGILNTLLWLWL